MCASSPRFPDLSFVAAAIGALTVWLSMHAVATAAPITQAPKPDAADASASNTHAGPDAGNDAKTVQLLIDLRPKTAGIQFGPRARSQSADDLPAQALRGGAEKSVNEEEESLNKPASGLFGAAATPVVNTQAGAGQGPDPLAPMGRPVREVSADGPAPAYDASRSGSGPLRDAIQFLREHRVAVGLSVLVVLASIWGFALLASRQRG